LQEPWTQREPDLEEMRRAHFVPAPWVGMQKTAGLRMREVKRSLSVSFSRELKIRKVL